MIFMTFLMANATVMQRVYRRDYGVIDRTVLVFNRALDFKVEHNDNVVEILLPNCSKDDSKVSNELFTNSNVLKSYTYKQEGNNLLMKIILNDSYTTVNHSEFSVEYLSYQQDVYKIALDIFATQNPESNEELLSFVNFYTTLDQKQKAKIYKEKLTQKIERDKEEAAEKRVLAKTEPTKASPLPQEKQVKTTTAKQPKQKDLITSFKSYLIPFLILILAALVVWIIIRILKQGKNNEDSLPHDLQPVGREEFRTRVIKKLLDHDWNKRVISMELKVPISEVEEVENQYQQERAEQLENEIPTATDSGSNSEAAITQEEILEPEEPLKQHLQNDKKTTNEKSETLAPEKNLEQTDNTDETNIEKIEAELNPVDVTRESDEADELEMDESLKEMLAYDSSDNPKGDMTEILENVEFSADDIENFHQEKIKEQQKSNEENNDTKIDPEELLKKAILNKLDHLEEKDPYNKE